MKMLIHGRNYSQIHLTPVSQQTFQRRFNVVFRLIWRRDAAQRQINVETTLCTSTLKLATFSNAETTLCSSTLNWTTLDNIETTFFPILRGICKRIFAEPQQFLKHRICWITKTIFKTSHFVKCFNFSRF